MRTSVKLLAATLLTALLLFMANATAASLLNLLPDGTLAAFGVEGLAEHQEKADVFIDEWNRLDLTNLLEAAYGGEIEDAAGADDAEIPEALKNADPLDLIGQELWVTVSVNSFNPLPAVTVVATMNEAGRAVIQTLFDEAAADAEIQRLTEGNAEFTVLQPPPDPDGGAISDLGMVLAYGQIGDLVVLSSNPDVARGVLRRHQGASEPNLADTPAFNATVGALGSGNFYTYVDLAGAVAVAKPFAAGMGFDALVDRLERALVTAGASGTVSTIVDGGFDGASLRVLGARDGDPQLYDLLAGPATVSGATAAFTSPGALGYSVATFDLPGWWAWLNDVAASEPQLGLSDLNLMVEQMLGLNLEQTLFSWMGDEVATINLGFAPATDIGTPLDNPLGESVYLVETTDAAAASSGIATLLQIAVSSASAFMDPMGEGEAITPQTGNVAGVDVTTWNLADGFTLSTAVADGYAIFATTPGAMTSVLEARGGGAGLSATLAPLRSQVPAGVRSFTLSDDRASMAATAETLLSQMGMLAGMSGADLDFDAAESANQALAQFVEFVGGRFGGSVSYTFAETGAVRSESHTTVQW